MNVVIREGKVDDLQAIRICIHEAYSDYISVLGKLPAAMVTDFSPLILAGYVYVLELNGEVVGTVTLKPAGTHIEISALAISPRFQHLGWGSRLMSFAEDCARGMGVSELTLYTNDKLDHLIRYYQKLGFVETERKEDKGYHRVFMRKMLFDRLATDITAHTVT